MRVLLVALVCLGLLGCYEKVEVGALFAPDAQPAAAPDAGPSPITERTRYIKPRIPQRETLFGGSVALSERWVMIGAPASNDCVEEDSAHCYGGRVTALRRPVTSTTTYEMLRPAPNRGGSSQSHQFGWTIALLDKWALVSAPSQDGDIFGQVYVFEEQPAGWTEVDKWTPDGSDLMREKTTLFGSSMALGEALGKSWAAIYSPREMVPELGQERGLVYVFGLESGAWSRDDRIPIAVPLPPPDLRTNANWGALLFHEDQLLVGVPFAETCHGEADCVLAGEVRVYVRTDDGWQVEQTLSGSGSSAVAFGGAMAASGDWLYVGAPGENLVYPYERIDGQWTERLPITHPWASNSGFGASLAAEDDLLWVGAPIDPSCGQGIDPEGWDTSCVRADRGPGAVLVFQNVGGDEWPLTTYIKPTTTDFSTDFGASLSVLDGTALVGAPGEDADSTGVDRYTNRVAHLMGAAFMYRRYTP